MTRWSVCCTIQCLSVVQWIPPLVYPTWLYPTWLYPTLLSTQQAEHSSNGSIAICKTYPPIRPRISPPAQQVLQFEENAHGGGGAPRPHRPCTNASRRMKISRKPLNHGEKKHTHPITRPHTHIKSSHFRSPPPPLDTHPLPRCASASRVQRHMYARTHSVVVLNGIMDTAYMHASAYCI